MNGIDVLGYHSVDTISGNYKAESVAVYSTLNFFGYIPVLGIFTGSYRIESSTRGYASLTGKIVHVVRGIFEFLGAGLVFLPLDLVVTAGRFLHYYLPVLYYCLLDRNSGPATG